MRIKKSSLVKLMIYIYICYWLLYLPFIQLQMAIIGRVFIGSSYIMAFEVVLLVVVLIIQLIKVIKFSKKQSIILFFLVFMSFTCARGILEYRLPIYEIGLFLFNKIFPLLFVSLIYLNRDYINVIGIEKIVRRVAWINIVMMLLQYFTGSIIWPYQSDQNGSQFFWSLNTYGLVSSSQRFPGIMTSGMASGFLSIVLFCILLSDRYRENIKKIFCPNTLKICVCAFSIVITLTRNAYVGFIYILVYVFTMNKIGKAKDRNFIGIIITSISIVIYFITLIIASSTKTSKGILNFTSSAIRISKWSDLIKQFNSLSLHEILGGAMRWQASSQRSIFSDNVYIEELFSIGIIGLFLYIGLIFLIQKNILYKNSIAFCPFAAMSTLILIIGVANAPTAMMEGVIFILTATKAFDFQIDRLAGEEGFS